MIVIGGLVFLIAFFGCCGAIREDTCMLTTYGVILSAILLIQVAIGVMAFVYKGKFESGFKKVIAEKFDGYDQKQDNKELVDSIQKNVMCCGLNGPDYWSHSKLPASCCGKSEKEASCTRDQAYQDGCEPKIIDIIQSSFKLLGAIALGIAAVELLCVVFAFCLASSIRREELRAYA
ncbi:hypothetical protein O3M35_010868 [Rhynocoris fuscipes]|uniref:Tetraspanin n=1 Tax=Rhynocoris fuscipes TaxID=488301 RepID=A0AAW1D610_9HEMI